MIKFISIAFVVLSTLSSCTKLDYNCSGEIIVRLNDSYDEVLESFEFSKRTAKNKYGEYNILTWTEAGVKHDPYLGVELLSVDLDEDRKIKKLYCSIQCADGYIDCTDFKSRTDDLIMKHFGCVPNLAESIKELNKKRLLVFKNEDFVMYSVDEDYERMIIIERT